MSDALRFEVASGSVLGAAHRQAGRNNQDAVSWCPVGEEGVVAVVADGCSAGAFSEVGARLGARLVAERLRDHAAERDPATMLEGARRTLLDHLRPLVGALGGTAADVVLAHFLFTLVGVVWTGQHAFVFGAGDGVVAVDGHVRVITAPSEAPDYVGYGLLADDGPALQVWEELSPQCSAVLVGSDGLADLHRTDGLLALVARDGLFAHPFALQRRLNVAARGTALPDDTTAAVVHRQRLPEELP